MTGRSKDLLTDRPPAQLTRSRMVGVNSSRTPYVGKQVQIQPHLHVVHCGHQALPLDHDLMANGALAAGAGDFCSSTPARHMSTGPALGLTTPEKGTFKLHYGETVV
uniref:Uncharacterized protein n=1 Tax=Knipowitschia caucasica TaxID=637954 RepID=A0AAV2M0J2_KNICA